MVPHSLKPLSVALSVLLASCGFLLIQNSNIGQAVAQEASDVTLLPSVNTDSIIMAGRIVTELEPISMTTEGGQQAQGEERGSAMMSNNNNMLNEQGGNLSKAQRFSMAQDVTWLLSGDWVIMANENGENVTFAAEFIKTTTDGSMLHTHSITNFNSSQRLQSGALQQDNTTISGTADVYFNDNLAWRQVDTDLTLTNGTVLTIELNSDDIDDHFHGEPIHGFVNSFTKDGTVISIPETDVSEEVQREFAELRSNATDAEENIAQQTSQAAQTFAEETTDIMGNITQSIRNLFG